MLTPSSCEFDCCLMSFLSSLLLWLDLIHLFSFTCSKTFCLMLCVASHEFANDEERDIMMTEALTSLNSGMFERRSWDEEGDEVGERRLEWKCTRKGVSGRKNIAGIPDISVVFSGVDNRSSTNSAWFASPLLFHLSLLVLTSSCLPAPCYADLAQKKEKLKRNIWLVLPTEVFNERQHWVPLSWDPNTNLIDWSVATVRHIWKVITCDICIQINLCFASLYTTLPENILCVTSTICQVSSSFVFSLTSSSPSTPTLVTSLPFI